MHDADLLCAPTGYHEGGLTGVPLRLHGVLASIGQHQHVMGQGVPFVEALERYRPGDLLGLQAAGFLVLVDDRYVVV